MKRKLISYICLVAIFMETIPVNALSNITSEIVPIESSEETKSEEESTEQKDEKTEEKEDKQKEESKSKLEDNVFNMYILDKIENELGFSIGFDEKEKKFKLSNQSEKQLSKTNLDSIIYKINIYDKENKEKLNIELLGKDTGNSEKLNILKDTKYETGDTIKIASFDPKKGIKILGEIKGDINKEKQTDKENEKVEDYSDGVDNLDYIDNVRFKITETNLETVYNNAPVFEGLTDLLDVEDPSVDVLQGIKVTDDHDGLIDNSKIVVSVQEQTEFSAILQLTVEDSWGRTTSTTRNISGKEKINTINLSGNDSATTHTVTNSATTPKVTNSIASNTITVDGVPYSDNRTQRFKIKFDAISNEIKVTDDDGRVLSYNEKGEYFKFVLYDKNMEEKTSVTLLGNDKSDSDKLNAINNYIFEDGDYIGIWHEESNTKLKIDGTVKKTQINENKEAVVISGEVEDYSQGVPQAQISERRFRIKTTGLEEVKNAAPTIGTLDPIVVNRGEDKDLLEGVAEKVSDDFDRFDADNIEKGYVSITHTPFDNTYVGNQIITYTATDRWGNKGTVDRTITVNSENPLDSTYIELMKSEVTDESLFKLKIDSVKKQLIVDNLNSLPDTQIDPSRPSSIFKLKIYTRGGVLQKTLNIKGTDKLKTVLRRINGYTYSENDRIELWSINPKNIRVFGNLVESNSTNTNENIPYVSKEVDGENYREDYTNGIDDQDYMKNVRFEIGKTNLKYIYNKAPVFKISTDLRVRRKGDVNYMDGISASDDHDDDSSLNITHTEIDTSTIGEKYIEYKVVDSWGRESTITRKLVITNGIDKNRISFKGVDGEVIGIGFDHANNRLVISKENKAFGVGDVYGYVRIAIKSADDTYAVNPIRFNVNENFSNENVSNELNPLRSYQLNYGDKLEIYHGHPIRLLINGKVIDAREDYEDGVDNPENLINTTFEITKSGLKAIYTNPDVSNITENKVVFGPMAPEKFPVKIQIDFREKKFKVLERTTTKFSSGDDEDVYRMVLIGSDGSIKRNSSFSGERYADTINDSEFWNNQRFDYNDCLYIWHKDPKRSIIKGNIINKREDYEDGVDNPDNMNHVVFRLTQNGLESIYNEAPVINGAKSVDVYKGSTFNLAQGITITDKFDTDRLRSISINGQSVTTSNDGTVLNPSSILLDTSTVGEKTVTYTATDRWGKETTINRKIIVRPYLYQNTFKIFSDVNEEEMISESDSTENKKNLLFEIGFDTVTNKYRVFNRND